MAAGEMKWEATQKKKKADSKPGKKTPAGLTPAMAKYMNRIGGTAAVRGEYTQTGGFKDRAQRAEEEGAADVTKPPTTGGGPSALDRYVQTIQRMLTGGGYRRPQDDLMAKLNTMYGAAVPQVNTAMDDLSTFLQGQQNPYAGFQAQAAEVSPQLTEFLQSQGASTTPLQQLAAVQQQQAANQAGAFQNIADTLGTIYGANQAGMVTDVAQQRANMLAALEGARAGYGTQIEQSAFDNQSNLLKMLLQGISEGGRPKPGRLTGRR